MSVEETRLVQAWNAPRRPLMAWVPKVQEAYEKSGLVLTDASELVGSTEAELEAVLRLGLLEEDILKQVSDANAPITTWLLLSEVSSEDIPRVLELARKMTGYQSDFQRFEAATRGVTGRASVSAVQNLSPELFEFAATKAKAYEVWPRSKNHYKALKDFAGRRRSSRPLTSRQTTYALGLLTEIVEAGAIRVPSPDDDDAMCAAILEVVA